jgi:hypothetical protein
MSIKSGNRLCRDDFLNNKGGFTWQKPNQAKAPDRNHAAARKGTVRAAGQVAKKRKAAGSAAEERRKAAEARRPGRGAAKARARRAVGAQKRPPATCRNGRLALARRTSDVAGAPTPAAQIHAAKRTFAANRKEDSAAARRDKDVFRESGELGTIRPQITQVHTILFLIP